VATARQNSPLFVVFNPLIALASLCLLSSTCVALAFEDDDGLVRATGAIDRVPRVIGDFIWTAILTLQDVLALVTL
jgi:hypothetical protein